MPRILNVGVKMAIKQTALALGAIIGAALIARPAASAPDTRATDTSAWWNLITFLSSDAMRGRDTGSPEHHRAAAHVANLLEAAGLKPLGDAGGFLQTVPLHEARVETAGSKFAIVEPGGAEKPLRFLEDISIRATSALPARLDAAMVFRGYCGSDAVGTDLAGKIVVCFGGRRKTMVGADERLAAIIASGAAGVLTVDDVGFSVEPPQWPAAYARSITLRNAPAPKAPQLAVMRLNPNTLSEVLAGSGHSAGEILSAAVATRPLPAFDLPRRLRAEFVVSERDFTSENVISFLPGTDPALANQAVVVDAHIDGYGIGAPVKGDTIYNGAFDDAAYVASLVGLAQTRQGKGFRRPLVFAVFTGEEKGLLGSSWFVAHPPIPIADFAANITLDAIRPLFPFKILTLIGSENSTLRANVERVAGPMGITVRADLEPERGMIRRTDASSFLGKGVPAVAFMFGYDPGSPEEAKFRNWYRIRYHKPQDDITQPIDFTAAAAFNRFFYALTADVADADSRPAMTPHP